MLYSASDNDFHCMPMEERALAVLLICASTAHFSVGNPPATQAPKPPVTLARSLYSGNRVMAWAEECVRKGDEAKGPMQRRNGPRASAPQPAHPPQWGAPERPPDLQPTSMGLLVSGNAALTEATKAAGGT